MNEGEKFTNGRKNKLKPYIRYKTGEFDYYYETNGLGRIEKFETDNFQLTDRTERLNHNKNTPGKVKGEDDADNLRPSEFHVKYKIDGKSYR